MKLCTNGSKVYTIAKESVDYNDCEFNAVVTASEEILAMDMYEEMMEEMMDELEEVI